MGSDPFGIEAIFKGAKAGHTAGKSTARFFNVRRARLDSEGYDPITVDACIEAAKNEKSWAGILAAADKTNQQLKKQAKILKNPPPIYGSAAWAKGDELHCANLLHNVAETPDGIYFGEDLATGKPIHWNGESHLLTIAPTRTGKGVMQIIPNLLRYRGSAIVLDPKGELLEATGQWRAENVGEVYVINPFSESQLDGFTDCFNPLDAIKTELDASKLAEMLMPRPPNDERPFFANEAIGFMSAVLYYFAKYADPDIRNIGTVRDMTAAPDREFYNLLSAMTASDMPAFIKNGAKGIASKPKGDETITRLIDSISNHMKIWDTEGLRNATAKTDFTFETLKDKPVTVYLVLPFDAIKPYSTFIQVLFATALDAMINNKTIPEIPVLFLLDEFLMLAPSERFVDALRTHAHAGMRMWFFLQDMATLKERYPKSWQSFMQVEVKSFFGTDDLETSKYVSEYLGKKTEAILVPGSVGTSMGGGSASYSINETLSLTARELLTPQEVELFMRSHDNSKPRKAIHFFRGSVRVKAKLIPWHLDKLGCERCGMEWITKT